MVLCFFLLLIAIISSCYAQVEDSVSLDGTWLFRTDLYNRGINEGFYKGNQRVDCWDQMKVPGNWDLEDQYASYTGIAWYRTTFKTGKSWKNKHIRLEFGGISTSSKVWLNGHLIGTNRFGFLRFGFNVTPFLNHDKPNILVVQVDNTYKLGALWNWGGIRRPVWLVISNQVLIDKLHITAIPNLITGAARITISANVENNTNDNQDVEHSIQVYREGKLVWKSSLKDNSEIKVFPRKNNEFKTHFKLPPSKVKLWSFNNPNLYDIKVEIRRNNETLDTKYTHFGIRKIKISGYKLLLNGVSVRPVGFNLVPDDRTTGNTLPLWRIKEDVDLMKSCGANMARISHLPLPEAFLDYLDEKGIMIIAEVSVWGKNRMVDPNNPFPKYLLKTLIDQEYNHPCIVGWSVGNEIGNEDKNPKVMAYVKQAISEAKKLDSNRLAVYISNSAQNQKDDPVRYSDMIFQNAYGGWGRIVKKDSLLHPGKPIFISELGQHINNEDPNKGTIDLPKMLGQLRDRKYVIGTSLWTFDDYRSNYTGTAPSQNRSWGIVNVFRQKKRAYYTTRREYLPFKTVTVKVNDSSSKKDRDITVSADLRTRGKNSFPIYPLKNYHLLWFVVGHNNKLLAGDIDDLHLMRSGMKATEREFKCSLPADSSYSVNFSILDPQYYTVYDTTIYHQKPDKPHIIIIHKSAHTVRVVFKKVSNADEYKIKYGVGKLTKETEPTIDNFLDIDNLKENEKYSFKLIAMNNYGYSASDVVSETVHNAANELPPIIWDTVPSDSSFYVGYSSQNEDFLYDVEYGTRPNHYCDTLTVKTFGVLRVPGLVNGKKYYFRLRRRLQWGFKSEWTKEISVIPDGNIRPKPPQTIGVLREKNSALLLFEPVYKSTGYNILLKTEEGNKVKEIYVNAANVTQAKITNLKSAQKYQYFIQAISNNGKSNLAKVINIVDNR